MENNLDAPEYLRERSIADVELQKLDVGRHLFAHAVGEVVDPDDAMALVQEPICEVTSDETGHARDRHIHCAEPSTVSASVDRLPNVLLSVASSEGFVRRAKPMRIFASSAIFRIVPRIGS
jgi:hypothetical protein